jgi:hypothetical protein
LGIDIAEDRRQTAVVAAGAVEGDLVLVDLRAYVDGPDATAVVLELLEERKAPAPDERFPSRKVRAVDIDPHSPAATLIKPLTDPLRNAGVKLLEPSTSDVVVAHGDFRHPRGGPVASRRPAEADRCGAGWNATPDVWCCRMGSAW